MAKKQIRRNFKDSLFRMIFREKKELLSLYNAVNGSDYDRPEELELYTIEDVIYMGMKNDAAFLIDDVLNLYEAQSTWNPNMPLRGVFYFSQLYQRYLEGNPKEPGSGNPSGCGGRPRGGCLYPGGNPGGFASETSVGGERSDFGGIQRGTSY